MSLSQHSAEHTEEDILLPQEREGLWELACEHLQDVGNLAVYLRSMAQRHADIRAALKEEDEKKVQQAFAMLTEEYNRSQRRHPKIFWTEAALQQWFMETPLWSRMVEKKTLLLPPVPREDAARLLHQLQGNVEPEEGIPGMVRKKPSSAIVKRVIHAALLGIVGLGYVQDHGELAVSKKRVVAEDVASKVLEAAKPAAKPTPTPSVTPTPKPKVPQKIRDLLRQNTGRQRMQDTVRQAAPASSPTPTPTPKPSASSKPVPEASPEAVASSSPSPTPTASPEKTAGIAERAAAYMTTKLESMLAGTALKATMDRQVEGAERIVYAHISPAASFVALAAPHKGGWRKVEIPAGASVKHTVEQDMVTMAYLLHTANTMPDPESFRDKDGKPLRTTVEQDDAGNFRVHFADSLLPGAVRYALVDMPEKDGNYSPEANKQHQWSEQTEALLEQVRGLPAEQQVESLRRYIQTNGKYSTNPEHFEQYAKTLEDRDKYMIMDCDVSAELLQAYLEELGIHAEMQGGYNDNGDGTLVQSELHGVIRASLPDGSVVYADATPTSFVNKDEEERSAAVHPVMPNPLAPATAEAGSEYDATPFEAKIAALRHEMLPLDDANRIAVYASILDDLDTRLRALKPEEAYLYDYVYKEMLIHGAAVRHYPKEVLTRISAREATRQAALEPMEPTGKTFHLISPVNSAQHLLPERTPRVRALYAADTKGEKVQQLAPLINHPGMQGFTIQRVLEAVRSPDGSTYVAGLVVNAKTETSKDMEALWLGDHLTLLGEAEVAMDGVKLHDRPHYQLKSITDNNGVVHVLLGIPYAGNEKDLHWSLDGNPLPVKHIKGFTAQDVELVVENGAYDGYVQYRGGDKILLGLLTAKGTQTDIEGEEIREVKMEQRKVSFSYGSYGPSRHGFMSKGIVFAGIEEEGKKLHFTAVQENFWVAENGDWGTYDRNMEVQGHLEHFAGGVYNSSDNVISSMDNAAYFFDGALHETVTVDGESIGVKYADTVMEFIRLSLVDDHQVLQLPDGRIISKTSDGKRIRQLEFASSDDLYPSAIAINDDGAAHALILDGSGIISDTLVMPRAEKVLMSAAGRKQPYISSFLLKNAEGTDKLVQIDRISGLARVVGGKGKEQPDWYGVLTDGDPIFTVHKDGTVSSLTLAGGSEGAMFHGEVVRPGDSLQKVAQQLSLPLPRGSEGKLKIQEITHIFRNDAGNEAALVGTLSDSPDSFLLTRQGMTVLEGHIGKDDGSGDNRYLISFDDAGLCRFIAPPRSPSVTHEGMVPVVTDIFGYTKMLGATRMNTVFSMVLHNSVGAGSSSSLLRGTILDPLPDGGIKEKQAVVFVHDGRPDEVVKDVVFADETGQYLPGDGLHEMNSYIDASGEVVIYSTAEAAGSYEFRKFVYKKHAWHRMRQREEVDLVAELYELLPPSGVLDLPGDHGDRRFVERVYTSVVSVIQQQKGHQDITPEMVRHIMAMLDKPLLARIQKVMTEKPARNFLLNYMMQPGDTPVMETGMTEEEYIAAMSPETFRQHFESALMQYAKEAHSW